MFKIATVVNVSNQPIQIMYKSANTSTSTIPASSSGVLSLQPSKSVTIEDDRLDKSQLEKLQNLRVIQYSVS